MANTRKTREVKARSYSPETIQAPMRRVVKKLKKQGVELRGRRAVEFFAREGNWQTVSYAAEVASLDAWEIDPQFEKALRKNLPKANVRIDNSFALAKKSEFKNAFDFIVIDNPQGIFGNRRQYCEHFEVLDLLPRLIRGEAVVIFDINRAPFNDHRFPEWQARREKFYKRKRTARLGLDFLSRFYRRYLATRGLKVVDLFFEIRHEDHFVYCVTQLARK